MYYIINEESDNKLLGITKEVIKLSIKDLDLLTTCSNEELIKIFIDEDELMKFIKPTKNLKEIMLESIISGKSKENLDDEIANQTLPMFSLIKSTISKLQKDYKRLYNIPKAKEIMINVNKDNIIKGLELAKKLDAKITIYCENISLLEFKEIFEYYNIEELKNYDIKIHYQEENSAIKPLNLYSLSKKISNIVEEVKKYNLSKLEQIMYVYDFVKNREYKKEEDNIESSRDIDKVIDGEYIVCSGYSNLFNAILKCLNISVGTILCYDKKHQRSIVYVQDEKYNIDGVYGFDPTMDRKKNKNDTEYINRYNGFMIPYPKSNLEYPDQRYKALEASFVKVISELKKKVDLKKDDIIDSALLIYNLVDNITLEELLEMVSKKDTNKKNELKYEEIKSKYKTKELDVETFIQVLYNTKRIEYVNDIIDEISPDTIKEIAYNKYIILRIEEIKKHSNIDNKMLFLLEKMYNEDRLYNYLFKAGEKIINSKLPVDTPIDRDIVNIHLVKVLKKIDK